MHWRFDAVSIGRPTGRWEGRCVELLAPVGGGVGRRPFGWFGIVGDDPPFFWDEVRILELVTPTMGVTPAHSFAQIDASDLAAFDAVPASLAA